MAPIDESWARPGRRRAAGRDGDSPTVPYANVTTRSKIGKHGVMVRVPLRTPSLAPYGVMVRLAPPTPTMAHGEAEPWRWSQPSWTSVAVAADLGMSSGYYDLRPIDDGVEVRLLACWVRRVQRRPVNGPPAPPLSCANAGAHMAGSPASDSDGARTFDVGMGPAQAGVSRCTGECAACPRTRSCSAGVHP
jgi:hypothetical protein